MFQLKWWTKLALVAVFFIAMGFWLAPYFAGNQVVNPVFLQMGDFTIYWYGLLMALAVLLGTGFSIFYLNRWFGFDIDTIVTAIIWLVVGGMVGARLVFVGLKWSLFAGDWTQIFNYTQGGLSIHGAILGGFLALVCYARLSKHSTLEFANLFIPAVVLGQAIGRFGNFFNQEAFGGPSQLPWKMWVAPQFRPVSFETTEYFHPTFLYESLGLLVILAFLLMWLPKHRTTLFGWYLVLYSSLRFIVEFFRIDSDMWYLLTIAQWASVAIVIVGWWLIAKSKKI